MQNDTDPVQQLIAFAKQLEPEGGYFGPGTLVDILDQDIAAMNSFRAMFKGVRAEELDLLDHDDNVELGWIIGGAADELDLLPDDPRLFKSDDELAVMKPLERQSELCSACIVNDVNAVAYLAPRTDVNRLDHNTQLALSYGVLRVQRIYQLRSKCRNRPNTRRSWMLSMPRRKK